ncbi:nitroreductase family protein [Candidatus Woesearchaeota archaeon]|nr:nitroreductase family protein [Candidatus Woesearchaeota archaeon]
MELERALKNRRSIRKFRQEEVPITDLKRIVEAGISAPSASNRQHWQFIFINDAKIIRKIHEEAGAQKLILNAPAIIAVFYDSTFNNKYNANIQSVSASVQNILLKAYEMGYGTCWVAGVGKPETISKMLRVPDNLKLLCLVLIGKPNENPFEPPKKRLDEVLHLNYFSGQKTMPNSIKPSDYTLKQLSEHQKYTSRAKYLGKDYEVYDPGEIEMINEVIKKNVQHKKSKIAFIMSYDGTILKQVANNLKPHEIIDLELSNDAINFVKFKTKYPEFLVMDEKIPLPDKSTDLAVFLFSLERFPKPQSILEEAKRILNDEGKMLIFLKNKTSFYGLMFNSIEKLLKLKDMESFISSGPFEPLSAMKIKKFLSKDCSVDAKGAFFIPPEVKAYRTKIDNYLKRHGKPYFRFFIVPALLFSVFFFNLTRIIKSPRFSSSVYLLAKKAGCNKKS